MVNAYEEYSVVFLGDSNPPTKVILLKRSETKKIAPGLETGIGGLREEEDQTIADTMRRELKEETGVEDIELVEFARLIIKGEHDRVMYYSFGLYAGDKQPPECNEGTLAWVPVNQMMEHPIIPTTMQVIEEWQNRGFVTDCPFTCYQRQISHEMMDVQKELIPVREGLYDFDEIFPESDLGPKTRLA